MVAGGVPLKLPFAPSYEVPLGLLIPLAVAIFIAGSIRLGNVSIELVCARRIGPLFSMQVSWLLALACISCFVAGMVTDRLPLAVGVARNTTLLVSLQLVFSFFLSLAWMWIVPTVYLIVASLGGVSYSNQPYGWAVILLPGRDLTAAESTCVVLVLALISLVATGRALLANSAGRT